VVVTRRIALRMFVVMFVSRRYSRSPILYPSLEAYYRSLGVCDGELWMIQKYGGLPQVLRRKS